MIRQVWFQDKAVQLKVQPGGRPHGVQQWARCFWNADLFYGEVPAIKFIAVVSWLIAYFSGG